MKNYEIVIIGGGVAGFTAAIRAADMGARTLIVEKDCLGGNWIFNGLYLLRHLLYSFGQMQWNNPSLYEGAGFKKGYPPDFHQLFSVIIF